MNIEITRRTKCRWIASVDEVQIASIVKVGTLFECLDHAGETISHYFSLETASNAIRKIYNEC